MVLCVVTFEPDAKPHAHRTHKLSRESYAAIGVCVSYLVCSFSLNAIISQSVNKLLQNVLLVMKLFKVGNF